MQIKTIKAATMKEALEKMKHELGPNATVLQTRKYKSGGIMGVGGKEMIEITAAIDDEDEPSPAQSAPPQPIQQPQPAPIQNKTANPIPQQPIQPTQPIQQPQPQPTQQTQPIQQPQPQKPTVRPRPKIAFKIPQKNPVPAQPQQPTSQPQTQTQPIQQSQPRPIQQVQPQPTQPIQQAQPKRLTVQPKIQPKPIQQPQPQPIQQPQPQPQPIQQPQPQPQIPQQMVENPVPIPEAVPEETIDRIEVTVNGAIQDDHIPDVTELSQEQNPDQNPDPEQDPNQDPNQDPDQDPDAFEDEEPEEVESVEQAQSIEEKIEDKVEDKIEPTPEEKVESKPEEKIESKSEEKPDQTSELKEDQPPEKIESKPEEKIEDKVEDKIEPKQEEKVEPKPEEKIEKKSSDIQILKTSTPLKMPDADLIGSPLPSFRSLEKIPRPKPIPTKNLQIVAKTDEPSKPNDEKKDQPIESKSAEKIESKPAEVKESAESSQDQKRIQELEKEIARMKSLLEQFMGVEEQKDQFISLQEALQNQDIDEDIIKEFASSAKSGILEVDNRSDEAKQALSKFMSQILKFSQGIRLNKNGVRVVALIGPTGVGKTTTLAKIAAKFVLEKNANVALITADTYRISAVEQLKTYADILGLPLETVYTPMELARAIRKHSDKKLILIDTAGRSQFNRVQMRELQDFLKISPHIERHLVLSATTRPRDANDIIEKFSACLPNRLVVTKTDETSSTGSLLKLLRSKNIPLSYVTHGQSVPDDILPASAEVFADVLLGRIRNDDFDDQGI